MQDNVLKKYVRNISHDLHCFGLLNQFKLLDQKNSKARNFMD